MRISHLFFIVTLIVAFTGRAQYSATPPVDAENNKARMQIVFARDATGSMSGLISAAKDKIWSIVSSLSQTQSAADIEVGLIFYRDRGDAFVTKRIPLTDSIDQVYAELMQIRAEGGGDGPESVNQGLNEAVESFAWAQDTSTYKAVFLVGDYEPHMNYRNDVPYYESCKIARTKDITLNTILMGNNRVAEKVWKEIAGCNNGAFVNVNMNANDIAIVTPYDAEIALIGDQLDDLRFYYGKAEVRANGNSYKVKGKESAKASKDGVRAQRAEYNAIYFQSKSSTKQNELLSDIASGNLRLDSLQPAELPDEFRHLDKAHLEVVIKQKTQLRDSLQQRLQAQVAKRKQYIEAELAKRNKSEVDGSFNNIIFENIQKQTRKKKIVLQGKAKY